MIGEIISVGTELLLGQIVNTNARFLSERLALLDIDVYFHTVVGDNKTRLLSAIREAEKRADLLIFTGGLGPTDDDITKTVLAEHLQVPLVEDGQAMKKIKQFFVNSSLTMTENNYKQALVLKNSHVFPNNAGLAPGMGYLTNERLYLLFPGPPFELTPMFEKFASPFLAKQLNKITPIQSRVLHFFGIGEAALEERIIDLLKQQKNPTMALLASDGEVVLRLTVKSFDSVEGLRLLDELECEVLKRVGKYFYGRDGVSLLQKCFQTLEQKNLTIAVAESFTGGMFQEMLTSLNDSSKIFVGGMVTYSPEAKQRVLGVSKETIAKYGVVSNECAKEMAEKVRTKFNSDIGVSFTGVAGPKSLENKDVGTIFIAFSFKDEESVCLSLKLGTIRERNRVKSVKIALDFLIKKYNNYDE